MSNGSPDGGCGMGRVPPSLRVDVVACRCCSLFLSAVCFAPNGAVSRENRPFSPSCDALGFERPHFLF